MKNNLSAAAAELLSRDDFALLSHQRPDGDTLGSSFALAAALISMGKRAKVEISGEIPQKYRFLADGLAPFENFDAKTVVSIDVANPGLLGEDIYLKYGGRIDLCIDHHLSGGGFGRVNYVDAGRSSTGELVFELIKKLGVKPDRYIARALYTALATDTGCFKHQNTNAASHFAAAELIGLAGDVSDLNFAFFTVKSRQRIALERLVLKRLSFFAGDKAAISYILLSDLAEHCASEEEADSLTELVRSVEGVSAGALIKESERDTFRVSVRTNGGVNAARICGVFGGGGHEGAAGCTIKGGLSHVKKELARVMEGFV